ncbi:hypothetical protein GQ600_2326 [Phytophthora cactorum]|nr:hypothetical protein GQ600_2326 [Phytophthora cactorum]
MWRQSRRKSKEHNTEVMLIIDKSCDDNITPLFRAAKARCGHVTKQMNDASIDNELVVVVKVHTRSLHDQVNPHIIHGQIMN